MKEKSENTAEYRFHMLRDPYRPGYHFAIPSGDGRPGDPNGAFFADGRYHLMYLYGITQGRISAGDTYPRPTCSTGGRILTL